ncbi:carbonic anhydrase [Streptomyces sp. GMY02]|uniref:carbonic anhydrase n=1 Tax=Streptomyces sp. GMY02 TaxID=1333528 RepID=UPI001C2CB989|nr:carbonic anhydrase [Streptomyces sp. GMY02]QXE38463.1 carbonic anhydrase [Streptomyces sp. GMY02]
MQPLIDHARNFPAAIADRRQEFAQLAHGQRPLALFISCSDSRVVPSLVTGARPGQLFELRTAGNIVPRYRAQAACGVAAGIEFAVKALNVPDIVGCGHSHCGAVEGLVNRRSVESLPLVQRWLSWAGHRPSPAPTSTSTNHTPTYQETDQDPTTIAQRHLVTQLDQLRSYPCVARRLAAGRLRLHGWFYAVDSGQVLVSSQLSRVFRPL